MPLGPRRHHDAMVREKSGGILFQRDHAPCRTRSLTQMMTTSRPTCRLPSTFGEQFMTRLGDSEHGRCVAGRVVRMGMIQDHDGADGELTFRSSSTDPIASDDRHDGIPSDGCRPGTGLLVGIRKK